MPGIFFNEGNLKLALPLITLCTVYVSKNVLRKGEERGFEILSGRRETNDIWSGGKRGKETLIQVEG